MALLNRGRRADDGRLTGGGQATPADPKSADLRTLGLAPGASWEEITAAHARLVSDLTPGPDASHRNVELARRLLREVNQAFDALRIRSVA